MRLLAESTVVVAVQGLPRPRRRLRPDRDRRASTAGRTGPISLRLTTSLAETSEVKQRVLEDIGSVFKTEATTDALSQLELCVSCQFITCCALELP